MVNENAAMNERSIVEQDTLDAQRQITVSVVSHGQGKLIKLLLGDLEAFSASVIDVVLTINIAEELPFVVENYSFPIKVIRNSAPKGFGANHNAAFRESHKKYFCVLNPDVRFDSDVFQRLLVSLEGEKIGLVAPLVLGKDGQIEDNARRIPTPLRIVSKLFIRRPKPDYVVSQNPIYPDWVAGMFMLFPSHIYERMYGFDERYFLYYEDVDLCLRMRLAGYRILLVPSVSVMHDARRDSRRNFRYLRWHLSSIARFFLSAAFWRHILGVGAGKSSRAVSSR